MRCGNCQTQPTTVKHVRECYRERYTGETPIEPPTTVPSLSDLARAGEDIEGVYFDADESDYYKVVRGTNTGNWYAKEFVEGEDERGSWEYRGRAPLHRLTMADRVNAEQASRFGRTTGICVFCSRGLTDERSIAVGYGPVCAEREGLPWGEEEGR